MGRQQRARYPNYVKEQVRQRYGLCRTAEDKGRLAQELGVGSVAKLYNLASRVGAMGQDSSEESARAVAHEDRLLIREDPQETKFTVEADRYLKAEFGRRSVEAIAFHLHHSETAILYRARHLGKRMPVTYWDVVKVAAWFGMEYETFKTLSREGVDIYPLHDKDTGRLVKDVVSTTSLGRWMTVEGNLERLRAQHADEFFVAEVQESLAELDAKMTAFERCRFLSHGHVCMNTYAMSFGLYCTNTDRQRAGEDPRCSVRTLNIDDLRPIS